MSNKSFARFINQAATEAEKAKVYGMQGFAVETSAMVPELAASHESPTVKSLTEEIAALYMFALDNANSDPVKAATITESVHHAIDGIDMLYQIWLVAQDADLINEDGTAKINDD